MSAVLARSDGQLLTSIGFEQDDHERESKNAHSYNPDTKEFSRQLSAGGNGPVETVHRDSFRFEDPRMEKINKEHLRISLSQISCQVCN